MNFVWIILVHLVEVPEEEKLSPAGGGASHMAEEVAVDIPESSVKAQDHLHKIEDKDVAKRSCPKIQNWTLETTLLRLP